MLQHYRQGDLLFIRFAMPENAVPVAPHQGRYVLAEGEATGHAHTVSASDVEVRTMADALFVRAGKPTEVVHEEHDPVTLITGVWRVVRQVEHTPTAVRRVLD